MRSIQMLASTTAVLALLAATADLATAQQAAAPPARYEHIPAGGNPPPAGPLRNPHKGSAQAADEGGKLFGAFNCDGCHAGGAVGAVGPSLADGRWRYGGADGEIYQSVFYGGRGMPAFGGLLPAESIWRLVTYLQSLQPAKDTISTVTW